MSVTTGTQCGHGMSVGLLLSNFVLIAFLQTDMYQIRCDKIVNYLNAEFIAITLVTAPLMANVVMPA